MSFNSLQCFILFALLRSYPDAKVRQISSLKTPPPGTREIFTRIVQLHGPIGLFYGFLPTLLRQGCSSALRFTAYNSVRQMGDGFVAPGERMSSTMSGTIELFASYAAVYVFLSLSLIFFGQGVLIFL